MHAIRRYLRRITGREEPEEVATTNPRVSPDSVVHNEEDLIPRSTGTSSYDGIRPQNNYLASQGNYSPPLPAEQVSVATNPKVLSYPVVNDGSTRPEGRSSTSHPAVFDQSILDIAFEIAETGLQHSEGGIVAAEDINRHGDFDKCTNSTLKELSERAYPFSPEYISPILAPSTQLDHVFPQNEATFVLDHQVNNFEEHTPPTAFIFYILPPSLCTIVFDIALALRERGVKTRLDAYESTLISTCRTDWYTSCIEESDLVVVCVDKMYKRKVKKSQLGVVESEEDQRLVDAIYVNNQLQTKYVYNKCMNFNLIPLLIDGATISDIPTWMQNTIIYRWPRDQDKLVKRILRT